MEHVFHEMSIRYASPGQFLDRMNLSPMISLTLELQLLFEFCIRGVNNEARLGLPRLVSALRNESLFSPLAVCGGLPAQAFLLIRNRTAL